MMLRKLLPLLLLLLAVALVSAWSWLLHTESGARFAWSRATDALGNAMSAADLRGDLSSGLRVSSFVYETDGVRITAEQVEASVDIDILPLSIAVNSPSAREMRVTVEATNSGDEEAADPGRILDSLQLPFRLLINDLKISDAVVVGVREDDIVIHSVALSAWWKEELRVDSLVIDSPEVAADVTAVLGFWRPYNLRLKGELSLAPPLTRLEQSLALTTDIVGDLDRMSLDINVRPYNAHINGFVRNVLEQPNWDLVLDAASLYWPLDGGPEAFRGTSVLVRSEGDAGAYSLSADAVISAAELQPTHILVSGAGNTTSLKFSELSIQGDDLTLTGDAAIDWNKELELFANLVIERANIYAFNDTWPATHPVAGSMSLALNNERIEISNTQLRLDGSTTRLSAEGELDFVNSTVAGKLAWQDLQWPIDASNPNVSSRRGDIVASGTLQDWRVSGTVDLMTAGVGNSSFTIAGGGDEDRAALNISEGALLGGRVSGMAAYSWRDVQPYSASLIVKDVQTTSLLPEWPAILSGQLHAGGTIAPFAIAAQIQDVTGSLRDKPLTASGTFSYGDGVFVASNFSASHGESEFSLDGDIYSDKGIDFSAAVAELGAYVPELEGGVVASGTLSLTEGMESLRLTAGSERLRYGDIELIDVSVTDFQNDGEILDLEAAVGSLIVGGDSVDKLSARITATQSAQDVKMTAVYSDIAASMSLQGAFDDWRKADIWRGAVTNLSVQLGERRKLQLTETTPALLSRDRVSLEQLCLADDDGSSLCARVSWSEDELLKFSATLQELRVNLINVLVDTGFDFNQVLSGDINWNQQRGKGATGSARIGISAGQIQSLSQTHIVRTAPGEMRFSIADGNLLSGNVFLPMPGTGSISGTFSVLDIAAGAASAIQGNFGFSMNAIDVLAVFSPLVDRAEGSLTAGLRLSGTVAEPSVFGSIDLKNAGADYLPIGLQLDDVNLRADLLEDQSVKVKGTFRAGEGYGEIDSAAEYRDAKAGIKLRVRGDKLKVISVPDVTAVADINVGVEFRDDELTLDGEVLIPWARVTPQDISARKISESSDVVIVNGELPESDIARKDAILKIFGEMRVAVGDDVDIKLDLAEAQLTGAAVFRWSGDIMPKAQGRYDLTGDIEAYGQSLKVVEGAIRFSQGSADNPELRIRAEREIYGNSQVKQAGVLVAGTAKRPTLQAYTVPMTTEERALTLLVTGSDFNLEQGVGAIDFGTYIAPRLFISYGIGLFDQENVISARYDLARGFGIKATSGQKESGLDFIYRLER